MTNAAAITLQLPKALKNDHDAILNALREQIDRHGSPDQPPITSAEVVAGAGTVHLACGSFNPYYVVHVKRDGQLSSINSEHRLIWLPQKRQLVAKRRRPSTTAADTA